MEEWNDKENYYLFTLEVVIADDPSLEILEGHLQYYEEQEEYMICAGIKLGIEFARFNRLLNLTKQLEDDKRNN
jgi:hypothetical protein